jgi:MFS family permease
VTTAADRTPTFEPVSRSAELATYAAGFFSLSLVPMSALVIPLWSLELAASPTLIGIAVGIRSLLPAFLSIHGGALMDRLGVRRVMIYMAVLGAVLPPLYPLLPSMASVIALQLVTGLTQALAWIGAQTQIAQMTKGSATHAGRLSFASTFGTFAGPLVIGWTWDQFGVVGAFALLTVWSVALLIAVLLLPSPPAAAADSTTVTIGWRDVLPRLSDYRAAVALLAVPAIAFVIAATLLRISAISIQQSFYTVYLESIALPGTLIGTLIGLSSLIGGPAALLAGPATRWLGAAPMLIVSIAVAIIAISITPLLTGVPALMIAAAICGVGLGLSLPLVVTVIARGAEGQRQGMSFGLRGTANRVGSLIIPIAMGAIADLLGLLESFAVVGIALLMLTGATALTIRWLPATDPSSPQGKTT